MRVARYIRVSTTDQHTRNQRHALEQYARARQWTIVETYEDTGVSGT